MKKVRTRLSVGYTLETICGASDFYIIYGIIIRKSEQGNTIFTEHKQCIVERTRTKNILLFRTIFIETIVYNYNDLYTKLLYNNFRYFEKL